MLNCKCVHWCVRTNYIKLVLYRNDFLFFSYFICRKVILLIWCPILYHCSSCRSSITSSSGYWILVATSIIHLAAECMLHMIRSCQLTASTSNAGKYEILQRRSELRQNCLLLTSSFSEKNANILCIFAWLHEAYTKKITLLIQGCQGKENALSKNSKAEADWHKITKTPIQPVYFL